MAKTETKKLTIDLPRQRGLEQIEDSPKARSVSLDKKGQTLKIELKNDVVFMVPTRLIQIFNGADEEDIREVELLLDGMYLRWPRLDEDLKVQSLLEGTFGTVNWMSKLKDHLAELGRKGGGRRSESKTTAARNNGAKGGRPRKVQTA